ncbi:S-layer homology domain-containing protein [Oscillibacter sp.]|uniref:S-layer homology domain-containing protein n=1 Tax=Oscillibacter sp. TaxID=1945593 RepID=UPI0033992DFA
MKKRFLSILLSVCMVLTMLPTVAFAADDYGICVGTTKVTSDNANNVLGNGTVTYDAGTNTLTLIGATITSVTQPGSGTEQSGNASITGGIFKNSGDLNIVLHGTNTIGLSTNSSFGVAGIYTGGQLSIKGTSTSTDSLSVVSTFTTQGEAMGIRGNTGVTIDGCTVTATAGSSTGNNHNTVGIYVGNGSLSIKNAIVTGTGGSSDRESYGIGVDSGSLSIENSTVTANGGEGTEGSYGMSTATTTIAISSSTVTATGNTNALYFGGAPTATGLTATASTNRSGDSATAVTLDSSVYGLSNTYKYVQIAPANVASQARWGVAGSGDTAPTAWTYGTLTEAMSYANSLASGKAYIQLREDVDITEALTFASGKATILDLNGKDIDRGLTEDTESGNVINVSGSLTLKDSSTDTVASQGKITGGFSKAPGNTKKYYGGCVDINESASFTMQGGNITGNRTTFDSAGGGGVYVDEDGSFTMTGGSIADNEALYWGGGVYAKGSFTMLGGSITGNKSVNGGVYLASNFTVGGMAVIDDNTVSGSSTECNVVLFDKTILVDSTLASGASIGVTAYSAPSKGSPGSVTGANSNDYSGYFHSDNSSYIIQNGADNVVQLAVGPFVIGPLSIPGSFTAGHNLTLNELNSYKPSITQNDESAVKTDEGWQQYNPNSGGYWETLNSGITPDTGSTFTLRYYVDYTCPGSPSTVYSNAVTLNVVGNTTALALAAAPASPQDTGTPITLTATLTGFFSGPGVDGQTITIKNGETTLGTASLNSSGVAAYTWTPSVAGSYSLTAAYAATAYNKAATSSALSYTVNAVLPTAAAYAAGASSTTDYVLDGTNKTLTINTAKGAAFWSASGTSYLDYTILLANDVNVSGFSWMRVGDPSRPFTGSFDGQGHSITGLTASAEFFSGLLGRAEGATIKNLCLSGSVRISNNVGSDSYGGALVAYAMNCTITNCCSHTDVTATGSGTAYIAYAGGLVGIADSQTVITNCFNNGSISATASGASEDMSFAYAGGIAGNNYNSNTINCYSVGSVTATADVNYAGGVAGYINGGSVKFCYYLNSAANKGIGGSVGMYTVAGCGMIGSDKATLTAGTAAQFASSAQTLAYTATLIEALNGWVNAKASTDYRTWKADSGNTNGGYPLLGAAWAATASLDLIGVGCDVAAGKLTGTTTNMQYSLDGGTSWQDCAAPDTAGLTFSASIVKVRQKDKTTNERTVITIAAPAPSGAPTLESKTSSSVTLTAVAGYEYSRDGGVTWQDSNSFSGLSSSTAYSFVARIKTTAATLPGTVSTVLSVTTSSAPSGGGTGSGSSAASTGAPVIVDGKTQNIGTEKKSGDTTTVTVDQSKLGTNIGGAAAGSSVVVPVSGNGSATASLVVKNIEDMAAKSMTLTVQAGGVAYNLNTAAIDTSALGAAFPGVDRSKVPFDVAITNSSVSVTGETLVLSPVAFTVTATYGGKTVDVDTFSAYIDRVIEVTKEQAAKITTAVVVNADGSVRHVPTNVIEKNGKYYAVINSRTNSTYALIQNKVTFADAKGKWYEAAVNEMGSRKIIAGRSASVFDGEASITRAEFAVILVRALGLPADGTSTFSDIPTTAWYTGAVATAVKYGLTKGKDKNRFDPNANITRQEAMLMLQRAAALTEFTGTSGNLDSFADANSVGSWARDAAKWSVGSGLIQGTDGKLNPTAKITRAQSATVILRLLQKAGLVDVRS